MDDNSYIKLGLLYASNKLYLPKLRAMLRQRTHCLCIYLIIRSLQNSHELNRPDIWGLEYKQKLLFEVGSLDERFRMFIISKL